MAVQFQSKEPSLPKGDHAAPLSRSDEERLTMHKRMEAFYRQSGGPNNPEIAKILEKHLLYGKDHGPKGKRETLEDALRDTIIQDYSNQIIFKWFMQARMERQKQAQADRAELARMRGELEALKRDIAELRSLLQGMVAPRQADAVPPEAREEVQW